MQFTSHRTPHGLLMIAVGLLLTGLLAACGAPLEEDGTTDPASDPSTSAGQDDAPVPTGTDDAEPGATEPDATDPDDAASDDASAQQVGELAFTDCEADRYTVGYPGDWNTNGDDGILGPCEIFHPGDIDTPDRPRDRDLHYGVSMYVDAVEYDDRQVSDNPNEVIDEHATTVDGRRARAVEFRSAGEALTPKGEYSYTWSVDLDGEILVATTSSVGPTDYEHDKRIIDRMMTEELTIHDEQPQDTSMVAGPSTTSTSSEEPDGWPLVVTDVRVGTHDSFDRLVFEIGGEGDAGWHIEYVDDPRSQGSGNPVDVAGDAVLRVTLRDMAYPGDAPTPPYDGPERITPTGPGNLVEVVEGSLFEGHHDFFVGLEQETPYRVERLTDPQRIVVDITTE